MLTNRTSLSHTLLGKALMVRQETSEYAVAPQ